MHTNTHTHTRVYEFTYKKIYVRSKLELIVKYSVKEPGSVH